MNSNYGEFLKGIRESRRLTLREVEKRVDISNAYLSQLESGKVKQPSPIMLHKLAELYELPYDVVMEKVGYPVSSNTIVNANAISHRLGAISDEEEKELLDYLKFIRNRKK